MASVQASVVKGDADGVLHMDACSAVQDMSDADEAKPAAAATMAALKRSAKCGPRRTVSPAKKQQQPRQWAGRLLQQWAGASMQDHGGRKQLQEG
jgi:hypothetical protein